MPLPSLTYRYLKGSRLTSTEVDNNFLNHDGRLTTVEAAIPAASVGIASISQSGNSLYVTLTDASVLGPFALPVTDLAFLPWQPNTFYTEGQFIVDPGSTTVYAVRITHTSAATFDPGANEGSAGDIYELLLSINNLPAQLTTPLDGDILRYRIDTSGESFRNEPAGSLFTSFPVESATVATDGTWSPTISGGFKTYTFSDGAAIVLPTDDDVPLAIGTEIAFVSLTDSDLTVEGAMIDSSTDVDVLYNSAFAAKALGRNVLMVVKKLATNTWLLTGTLANA